MSEPRLRSLIRHFKGGTPGNWIDVIHGNVSTKDLVLGPSTYAEASDQTYRYTLDKSFILSEEQRQFFEENGYIVVKGLVPKRLLEEYKYQVKDITGNEELCEEKRKILENVLHEVSALPQILDYVEGFCGNNISSMSTMLVSVPPGTPLPRMLHQNRQYLPFKTGERIVSAWTVMDSGNEEPTEAMVLLPGSHKTGLLKHSEKGGLENLEDIKGMKEVHLKFQPGDVVFIHPNLIHGSLPNSSKGFRKEIYAHFASSEDLNFKDSDSVEYWKRHARVVRSLQSKL